MNDGSEEEDAEGSALPPSARALGSLALLHLFPLSLALSSYASLTLILTFTHFVAL